MDVSLLQEKSTFPVLTMRMSPHLEPFFFFFYDCILHKCCAISNQYHFTNPISTFLPKFQGEGPDPRSPSLDPPMVKIRVRGCVQFNNNSRNAAIYVLVK